MGHDREATSGGRIVTFYSYKGGVGRTMALANVAWILATNGKRVLAMDWDLESPGLHRYFHPFLVDKRLRRSPGVIEMVRDFAAAAVEPTEGSDDADWFHRYADVARVAVSLVWRFPGDGVIDLVPAGQQDESYSIMVGTFDWPSFYERLGGASFLRALRANLREYYDYVLIDSRTGLSDTASICTVLLPDTVVNCFTLNEQSIDGAAAVADSIIARRVTEPVRLVPVPMRVEDAEQEKLEAGRDYAQDRFASFLSLGPDESNRYWEGIEIPYKPFYAYEEILAAFGDRPGREDSLLAALERLTRTITDGEVAQLTPLDEKGRRRWLAEFERPRRPSPPDVLISYVAEDRTWAEWIAAELGGAGLHAAIHEIDFSAVGWAEDAERLLSDVHRYVALLSPAFVAPTCAAELWQSALTRDTGHILVPIRLGNARIPPFVDGPPVVDFSNLSEEQARESLFAALDLPAPFRQPDDDRRFGPRFPATPPPVWSVPRRNATFTGRVALLEVLRDRLAAGVTVLVPQAPYGLGGVGTTQVALEYAYRFAADYDIVWWISAEQPGFVRASLVDLAVQLGMPSRGSGSEDVAAALSALRQGEPYRRWLLIFDNAGKPEELAPCLPQGPGHVLVTSRDLGWCQRPIAIEMGVFVREESILLLHRHVPGLSDQEADQLAERLCGLPLALEQAGAWLAVTGMRPARYLELLEAVSSPTPAENPTPAGNPTSAYARTARATVLLSLERLREQVPAAARLVELCAFFAPAPVPLSLVHSERFVAALLSFDPALSDPLLQDRLLALVGRYALASVDNRKSSVQLHSVVRVVIQDQLDPAQHATLRRQVQEILVAANPRSPDDPDNWPVYGSLSLHLRASGMLRSTESGARQLVVDTVRYRWNVGDFVGSQSLAEEAVADWAENGIGAEDLTTLWLRVQLANALRAQARYAEALAIDEDVYRSLNTDLGLEHPYTIVAAIGWAADLRATGRHAQARDLNRNALAASRTLLGDDHPLTVDAAVAENLAPHRHATNPGRGAGGVGDDPAVAAERRLSLDFEPPQV